jgi:ADP-heptose:LPS heptosyltransferase
VFRIGHLGDTIVALPAIAMLAARHGGRGLRLITNKPAQSHFVTAWDVLRHTGYFDETLFYDQRDPASILRVITTVRRSPSPVIYYVCPLRPPAARARDWVFLRWLCGARVVGLAGSRPPRLRDADGRLLRLEKESARLLRAFSAPAEADPSGPFLRVDQAARIRVDGLVGVDRGDRLVALAIGSKMPAKKWFLDRYTEIGRRLLGSYRDVRIALVGAREDAEDSREILRALGSDRVVNCAGQTSIIESAELLARCRLYIGNDTGTMHLAAIMGTRCVAVFSSRDNAGVWEPYGEGHFVLRRELSCSGCMLEECIERSMECLRLISVDDVWSAVTTALGP